MHKLFKNTALRVLLTTDGLQVMAAAMLGPIYAVFVEEQGGNLLDAGLAGAAFAFAAGCTSFFIGRYSDKFKSANLILTIGYIILGTSYLMFLFAVDVRSIIFIQIALGLGAALQAPVFDAIYSKHIDKKNEGVEWGAWESSNYFVNAIGAAIGGYVANQYGFKPLFVLLALLCFTSAVISIIYRKKLK